VPPAQRLAPEKDGWQKSKKSVATVSLAFSCRLASVQWFASCVVAAYGAMLLTASLAPSWSVVGIAQINDAKV
jgi:hypothetical protein